MLCPFLHSIKCLFLIHSLCFHFSNLHWRYAVKQAAETLITTFGTTTTLDVKNKLRQQGFQAFQAEVSNLLDEVTAEEQWQFNHNGRYRIYRFGPDSNDTFHKYLENDLQKARLLPDSLKSIPYYSNEFFKRGTTSSIFSICS